MPNYQLICFETKKKEKKYLAVNKSSVLGEGGMGTVYRAYPFSFMKHGRYPLPMELMHVRGFDIIIDSSHPMAVKAMSLANFDISILEKEYNVSKPYLDNILPPTPVAGYAYMPMAFLRGFHLHSNRDEDLIDTKIKYLTFRDRVSAAFQMALSVQSLSHETPHTKEAIVHCDIKEENFLINKRIKPDGTTQMDVRLFDFGLAEKLQFTHRFPNGTMGYQPEETAYNRFSAKTDVYSLAPVIMSLFDAKNPMSLKGPAYFTESEDVSTMKEYVRKARIKQLIIDNAERPFSTKGMFEHCEPPKPLSEIKPIVIDFVMQMGAKKCCDRPTPEVVLSFFNALYNLTLAHYALEEDTYIEQLNKVKSIPQPPSWGGSLFSQAYTFFYPEPQRPQPEKITLQLFWDKLRAAAQFTKGVGCEKAHTYTKRMTDRKEKGQVQTSDRVTRSQKERTDKDHGSQSPVIFHL